MPSRLSAASRNAALAHSSCDSWTFSSCARRSLDVEADVGGVDAGARDLELVHDLHRLQLHHPAARQVGERQVLRQLGVRACRGTDRGSRRARRGTSAQIRRASPATSCSAADRRPPGAGPAPAPRGGGGSRAAGDELHPGVLVRGLGRQSGAAPVRRAARATLGLPDGRAIYG